MMAEEHFNLNIHHGEILISVTGASELNKYSVDSDSKPIKIFDKKKQGWHDKLAGTVVVRPKNSGTEAVRFG